MGAALLLGLALLALGGCSAPPREQARQAVSDLVSWSATVELTGGLWLQGRIPSHYTRSTLARAHTRLAEQEALLSAPDAEPGLAAERTLFHTPGALTARLDRAVARGDRAAGRQALDALREPLARLRALDARLSPPPAP
jgi:hypothetical protein